MTYDYGTMNLTTGAFTKIAASPIAYAGSIAAPVPEPSTLVALAREPSLSLATMPSDDVYYYVGTNNGLGPFIQQHPNTVRRRKERGRTSFY